MPPRTRTRSRPCSPFPFPAPYDTPRRDTDEDAYELDADVNIDAYELSALISPASRAAFPNDDFPNDDLPDDDSHPHDAPYQTAPSPPNPKRENNRTHKLKPEIDNEIDTDNDTDSDADIAYSPAEEAAVVRRLDRRLVGFLAVLYCLSFLDRSNIGNARIAGLETSLHLTGTQYRQLLWAFHIPYILFEWMTLLYRIIPPRIYIPLCIFTWGLTASLQSIASSLPTLLTLRALLGISEAAFGPGVPFYLSFFFARTELAFRTGLFISAAPLSAAFAGALAWLIAQLAAVLRVEAWRLLFLLEGFPSLCVAVWAWGFVPDGPGSAGWLSARERRIAVARVERERGTHVRTRKEGVGRSEVVKALTDLKCYLTAFMFFGCNVAFGSIPVFLPTIIRDMGFASLTAQALTAPPYIVAFVAVLGTAHVSDRTSSRSPFVIAHALVAALAYGAVALLGWIESPHALARYFALFPAVAGFFSCVTVIITWTINNQQSDGARGTGMAMLNVIGQCGPLVGTSLFPRDEGPWYVRGMAVCAGFMVLVALLAGVLRWMLIRENRRREGGYAGLPLDEGGRVGESVFTLML